MFQDICQILQFYDILEVVISMIKSEATEILFFSQKEIWDVITNNQDFAWRSDLSDLKITDETHFIEFDQQQFATNFTITEKIPMKRYQFFIQNKNITGTWIGTLTALTKVSTEVVFTEEIEVRNILMKFFAKGFLKKQQQLYFENLKKELKHRKERL